MIGLIYLTVLAVYFLVGFVTAIIMFRRSERHHRWLIFPVFLFIYLPLPWADLILKGAILSVRTFNTTLQEVRQTVDYPESVLWIDNVWPGFDEYGRHWMVENYLDGVRLKVLALNDGEGNLYVYRATLKDFSESETMRPEVEEAREKFEKKFSEAERKTSKEIIGYQSFYIKKLTAFRNQRKKEAAPILSRQEIYPFTSQILPEELQSFNYRVEFNPLPLTVMEKKLLWADEITITSIQNNEVIAYSKRYMSYGWWLDFTPPKSFTGGFSKGDIQAYEFDDKVLFGYAGVKDSLEVTKDNLDRSFYKLSQ